MPKKNALDGEGADAESQREEGGPREGGGPQREAGVRGESHGRNDGPLEGIDAFSYEEARSRLVEIVVRLEQGSIPLEESLRLWEIGEQLARRCQDWLDGARERLAAARGAPEAEQPGGESTAGQDKSGTGQGESTAGQDKSGTGQGKSADGQGESGAGRPARRASNVEGSERGSGREKQ